MEAFLNERSLEICVVMEFADGGDLAGKVEKAKQAKRHLDENLIWAYFIQLCDGLQALHSKRIIHRGVLACATTISVSPRFSPRLFPVRVLFTAAPWFYFCFVDIKTANLFLTADGHLKIGDLNVSKLIKQGLVKTQIGTPYYMSPEIWRNRPYDYKSDMWSVGCVLYELCALHPPFRGTDIEDLSRKVQVGSGAALFLCKLVYIENHVMCTMKLSRTGWILPENSVALFIRAWRPHQGSVVARPA
jgi:NIMA (never in mitosis gene a)-related kinase 1/4/5